MHPGCMLYTHIGGNMRTGCMLHTHVGGNVRPGCMLHTHTGGNMHPGCIFHVILYFDIARSIIVVCVIVGRLANVTFI